MFEFLKAFFYGKQFIYKFDRWKKKKRISAENSNSNPDSTDVLTYCKGLLNCF